LIDKKEKVKMKSKTFGFAFKHVNFGMDSGRAMLARILNGCPGSHEIFHYAADGTPLPGGMPLFRIHSHKNEIQVIALGEYAAAVFQSFVPTIHKGLENETNEIPSISITEDDISVTQANIPYLYVAHGVILDRGLKACEKFEKMTDLQRREKAHAVLCRGLIRQADELGLDLPEDLPELSAIELEKVHPRAPIVIARNGLVQQHGISARIHFTWEAKISGSWAVGGLSSKGHGRIWYLPQVACDGVSGD
jgi:hypothetical protein